MIKAAGTGVGNLPIGQEWSGAGIADGGDFILCLTSSSSSGLISRSLLEKNTRIRL